MSFIKKHIKINEELVAVVRKHWLAFFKPAMVVLVILLLDFFFIFPLLDWGTPGKIIFFSGLGLGLFLALRLLIKIKYNLTIITDERIIRCLQKGVLYRVVTEIEITDLIEVSYRVKGIWQSVFRYGSLMLRVKDQKRPFVIKHVCQPNRVQQLILSIQKMEQTAVDES